MAEQQEQEIKRICEEIEIMVSEDKFYTIINGLREQLKKDYNETEPQWFTKWYREEYSEKPPTWFYKWKVGVITAIAASLLTLALWILTTFVFNNSDSLQLTQRLDLLHAENITLINLLPEKERPIIVMVESIDRLQNTIKAVDASGGRYQFAVASQKTIIKMHKYGSDEVVSFTELKQGYPIAVFLETPNDRSKVRSIIMYPQK